MMVLGIMSVLLVLELAVKIVSTPMPLGHGANNSSPVGFH